jgi:hypothetical protein
MYGSLLRARHLYLRLQCISYCFSNVPAVCNINIQSAQITDHQASTIAATVYSLRQQTNVLRFLKFYLYIFLAQLIILYTPRPRRLGIVAATTNIY